MRRIYWLAAKTGHLLKKTLLHGGSKQVFLTHYFAGEEIENNEISGACSAYGIGRGLYGVLVGNPEGKPARC
jgi:hypothetical protein